MISIRDARIDDAPALVQLIEELGYPVNELTLWPRIERMPPELYRTLVAVSDTGIAGFAGLLTLPLYEHERPIGWILSLSVALAQRRKGIGKALVGAAEAHFRERGIDDIRLNSGLWREDARRFYEGLGYEKTAFRFRKKLY